jgi:hypothetical protein
MFPSLSLNANNGLRDSTSAEIAVTTRPGFSCNSFWHPEKNIKLTVKIDK